MRCAVVGAGAWGTALADLLARNGHDVALWAREPEVIASVNASHENSSFLAGARLDDGVVAEADLARAFAGAALVLFATPSHVLRGIARTAAPAIEADATIVVATKGIERETLAVMSDVLAEQYPSHAVVALSGPSFAAEVVARQPTAVVAASENAGAAAQVQRALSGDEFRVYTHDDVMGVELGGALKNVIAVATGIAEGLGMGFNARAALITRGLAEMTRLGVKMGASPLTFAGLAGMGDLVLTCTGALSRNRSLGVEIARGTSLDEALAQRHTVAEGVMTTHSARALAAREGIDMPIVSAVYRILFEHQPPRAAIGELMRRELRAEGDT
ncbi:MAG: NAD(P)-dependent glycerol-3-phosphate dehydrogenase [Gemmatimonadaceae bacterium]|nr:NAD(P)-dependent glycerol-3-phosphate dehydrogenase [Gemmatimonadaceae bacterium]